MTMLLKTNFFPILVTFLFTGGVSLLQSKFPVEEETYFLAPQQIANYTLQMWNGGYLPNFPDNDEEGNKIIFSIVEQSAEGLFRIASLGSATQLQMTKSDFVIERYNVTVTETIEATSSERSFTFKLTFYSLYYTDPIFMNNEADIVFSENDISANYQLENATYPYIDYRVGGGLPVLYLFKSVTTNESIFNVDKDTGLVTLLQPLDYEKQTSYQLVIQSSTLDRINPFGKNETKFELTVNVLDVNDNAPVFDLITYTFILTDTTSVVGQISASDVDTTSQGKLQYSISNITGSTADLEAISSEAFTIDSNSGEIYTNFSEDIEGMQGFFKLAVVVQDEDGLMDEAVVIVALAVRTRTISK